MSNDSKRVSELGIATTLANTDRVVVLTNPNTSAQTQTITLKNFANSLTVNALPIANATQLGIIKIGSGLAVAANGVVTAPLSVATTSNVGVVQIGNNTNLTINANGVLNISVTGPYNNDTAANTAGIAVGQMYYDSTGNVKIRLS